MNALEIADKNSLDILTVTVAVRCRECGREWMVRLLPAQANGTGVPERLFKCFTCREGERWQRNSY